MADEPNAYEAAREGAMGLLDQLDDGAEGDSQQPEGQQTEQTAEAPQTFKIRHRDQEHELTLEQLRDYAEKGFDYQDKTTKLAREREELGPLRQLADYMKTNPQFVQYVAAYDQIQAQHGTRAADNAMQQAGMDPRMMHAVQQVSQAQQQQGEFLQQIAQERIDQQATSFVDSFKESHPGFNATTEQIDQMASELFDAGVSDPLKCVEIACERLLTRSLPDILKANQQQYVQRKTNPSPRIQGGGGQAPARGNGVPKTWEQARAAASQYIDAQQGQL